MSMKITRADFIGLEGGSPAERTLAREKLEKKQATRRIVTVMEALSVSLAFGYLHGRKGTMPSLGPVPYDAIAGFALIGLSFIPQAAAYADDCVGLGIGAACYFVGAMGGELGQRMRKTNNKVDANGNAIPETAPSTNWTNTPDARTITAGPPGHAQWSQEQLRAMVNGQGNG